MSVYGMLEQPGGLPSNKASVIGATKQVCNVGQQYLASPFSTVNDFGELFVPLIRLASWRVYVTRCGVSEKVLVDRC